MTTSPPPAPPRPRPAGSPGIADAIATGAELPATPARSGAALATLGAQNGGQLTTAGDLLAALLAELARPDDDLGSMRAAHARATALKSMLDTVERGGALSHAAAAATLVAERRLGLALDALDRQPGKGVSAYQQAVHDLGVDTRTARYWRQVAAIATEAFESYLGPALDGTHRGLPVSRAGLMRAAGALVRPRSAAARVLAAAEAWMGVVELPDPTTDPRDWSGRLWVSPPDDLRREWADAVARGWHEGRIASCALHLPLSPSASWWSLLGGHPICILRPSGVGTERMGGVIFGLGGDDGAVPDQPAFARHFSSLGWCYSATT